MICKIGTVSGRIPTFFWQLLADSDFRGVDLGVLPVGGAYDYGESGNALNRAAASDPADCCDGAGASVVLRVFDSGISWQRKRAGIMSLLAKPRGMPARRILCGIA